MAAEHESVQELDDDIAHVRNQSIQLIAVR